MLEELKNELSKILNESDIIVDDIYIEEKNNYKFLTIVLDKVGGIDLDEIVAATEIINPIVDKYNICDDSYPSFHELEILISKQLGKNQPLNIPYWLANCLAHVGNLLGKKAPINSTRLEKIVKSLTFSNAKIKKELGFVPTDVLSNFVIR